MGFCDLSFSCVGVGFSMRAEMSIKVAKVAKVAQW